MEGVSDEDIVFADEDGEASPAASLPSWLVLVVDDDPEVHHVTRYALRGLSLLGRRLSFLEARSAAEGLALLRANPDAALVLLDVVMETDDAGLRMARAIREEMGNHLVRIILRTGQPGQAPERDVVVQYDINDYRSKDELTAQRLWTSVATALRAYDQLRALEDNRHGLEQILDASTRLFGERSLDRFTEGVVLSLRSLVGGAHGVLLARCPLVAGEPTGEPRVLAGYGPFGPSGAMVTSLLPGPLSHAVPAEVCQRVARAMAQGASVSGPDWHAVHVAVSPTLAVVVYVAGLDRPFGLDPRLVQLFTRTVAIGLDNVLLFEQLAEDRTHDRATGLLNRTGLVAAVEDRLVVGKAALRPLAVASIDLRRFRDINQELGVVWGDRLLAETAVRLSAAAGQGACCGRIGGDQFAILLPDLTLDDAKARVRDIVTAVAAPILLAGREVQPLATPGLAWCDTGLVDAEELLARAEESLQRSKRAHGRLQEVVVGDEPTTPGRLNLSIELNAALSQKQFELYYQPIVAADTREVVAFEALVRWRHPTRGIVTPIAFIPTAEETGLIVPIGAWAMREAALQTAAWTRAAGKPVWVSVNISAAQLSEPGFLEHVAQVIAETGVDPTLLKLEVTEGTIIGDPELAAEILTGLRDLGIRLCMDDFGTGYSNLSYLQTLPFDFLKVDRAFVKSMIDRFESRTILRTMMALAQQLELEVVAEGVESPEQADELARLGCHFLQGFLYGKPMPADLAGALVMGTP
ncbi:EAL domain-containing protein [Aerophototrophica crusticola]|uniref:EAL domain-containing protein n=1 Tax=Aerophototrophica crusticola TaxID=1709002 RepID=A0A858R7S3_9PROT|nr:EAL domain-containing protein [Rhodospirillaceae bacterium B3]